jgi:hypothetical protein
MAEESLPYLPFAPQQGKREVEQEEEEQSPTWADWGAAFLTVGVPETMGSAASGVRAIAEGSAARARQAGQEPSELTDLTINLSKRAARAFSEAGDDAYKADLTPTMKRRLEAEFGSEEFWEHPASVIGAQAVRTAPTAGAAIALGMVTPAGPWASVMVASLTSGGLEAAQTADQFYAISEGLTDEQLIKQVPYYKALRESGMDENAARQDWNSKFRGMAPFYVGTIGAALGAAGPAGQIVRGLKGVGHSGNIVKRLGKAAGEAGATETIQEGQQGHLQQTAQMREGLQDEYDYGQTAKQGIMGGLIGAALGMPGGVFKGPQAPATIDDTPDPGTPPVAAEPPTGATPTAEAPVTPKVTPTDPQPTVATSGGTGAIPTKPAETVSTADVTQVKGDERKKLLRTRWKYAEGQREKYNATPVQTHTVLPGGNDADIALALNAGQQATRMGQVGRYPPTATQQGGAQVGPAPVQPDVKFGPAPQGYLEQAAAAREQTAQAQPTPVAPAATTAPVRPPVPEAMTFGTEPTPQETPVVEAPEGSTERLISQGNQVVATAEQRKGPRILQDLTRKVTAQVTDAQAKKNVNVAEKKTADKVVKAGNRSKAELATKDKDEAAFEAIMRGHEPSTDEDGFMDADPDTQLKARSAIFQRAMSIVQKTEEAGAKLPDRVKKTTGRAMSPGLLLAVEARDLMRAFASKSKKKAMDAIIRFKTREQVLRSGKEEAAEDIHTERRVEGDTKMKGKAHAVELAAAPVTVEESLEDVAAEEEGTSAAPAEGTESEATPQPKTKEAPEGTKAVRQEHEDVGASVAPSRRGATINVPTTVRSIRNKAGEVKDEVVAAAQPGRSLSPEERAQALYEAGLGPKPVTPEVTPANARDPGMGEPEAPNLDGWNQIDESYELEFLDVIDGTAPDPRYAPLPGENRLQYIQRHALSSTTAATLSGRMVSLIGKNLKGPMRAIWPAFYKKIISIAGDVPVYVISTGAFERLKGRNSGAFYASGLDIIVLQQDPNQTAAQRQAAEGSREATEKMAHTLLHEMIHAAFYRAIEYAPHVKDLLRRIAKELKANTKITWGTEYEFKDVDEFLAEGYSNKATIAALMQTKASPGLAMGIAQHKKTFINQRIKTLWDALMQVMADALGLNRQQYTLMDAMLAAGAELELTLRDVGRRYLDENESGMKDSYAKIQATDPTSPWRGSNRFLRGAPDPGLDLLTARKEAGYKGSAFATWMKRNIVKFMDLNGLRRAAQGTIFHSAMEELTFAINRQTPERQRFRQTFDLLAQEFKDYAQAKYAEAKNFAEIALEATNLNVRILDGHTAATILEAPENAHLKGKAFTSIQARARAGALQERYNRLSPEGKALFQKMSGLYREAHNRIVTASVHAILDQQELVALDDAQRADIIKRTLNKQLDDNDKAVLGTQLFNLLHKEAGFHAIKGSYFPRMRYGDYVVIGTDKITNLMGGTQTSDNTVVFKAAKMGDARKAAEAFTAASDFHELNTRLVYFDATTGEQVTLDQSKSLNDVEYGYEVTLQVRGVHMFESAAEAHKFAEENPEGYDSISGVEDRLGPQYQAHVLTGTQYATMIASINQNEKLTEGQKQLLRTTISHAAARMLRGNRITSRRLQSKKVSGASHDFARNLLNYGDAAARHLAVAKAAPTIRKSLNEMKAALNGYEGKDRNVYIQIYNEVQTRVDQGTIEPNEPGKAMQDLMTVSFFTRLASPAYSVINGMQVFMVTAPVLGGTFGNMRAYRALMKAYADMGFGDALLGGVMNTAKAAKQWNKAGIKTEDLLDNILKKLDKQADGANLRKMVSALTELNAISTIAGFETSEAIAHGRGQWGHVLAKTDRIVRQMPQAIELINRTVSAVGAYRLARADGKTHDEATMFALETVQTTQGDYTASNAPRFFNNPYLRPAVQFKKYAHLYTMLMGNMVHDAFKGESKEVRDIAKKQLMNVIATQIAMAGALSLPGLELAKAAFMMTAALGLTGGWEDQEEKLKKLAEESLGKDFGQMVTSGVITRGIGIDVSSRVSAADLWLFGEPKKYDAEGIGSWLLNTAAGSAGTMVLDAGEGIRLVQQGEWAKGAGKIIPFKAFADAAKAAGEGKTEGWVEPALNAFGLKSARQAEAGRAAMLNAKRTVYREDMYKKLSRDYRKANTKGEQIRLRAKINAWNKGVPRHYQVYPDSLDKYRKDGNG